MKLSALLLATTLTSTAFGALQDYDVPAPDCVITTNDEVQCDFAGIVPAAGSLAYSITGYTDCTGTPARNAEMSLSAATATASAGATSVTINLDTGFALADGASSVFEFCLLTSLDDGSGNEMYYQGQKVQATFTADGGFTVGAIASAQFDGVSGTIDTESKTFAVTAFRCVASDNRVAESTALELGTTMFICLDAPANAVIQAVTAFTGSKSTVTSVDLLSGNTEVLDAGTSAVTIGTRPFSSFFADTNVMEVTGTVTLLISNSRRVRRNLRILQQSESGEFELEVTTQVAEGSSATSAYGAVVAFLGAAAAVAAI